VSANHDPFVLIDFQPAAPGSDVARGPMTRTNLAVKMRLFVNLVLVLLSQATPMVPEHAEGDT